MYGGGLPPWRGKHDSTVPWEVVRDHAVLIGRFAGFTEPDFRMFFQYFSHYGVWPGEGEAPMSVSGRTYRAPTSTRAIAGLRGVVRRGLVYPETPRMNPDVVDGVLAFDTYSHPSNYSSLKL